MVRSLTKSFNRRYELPKERYREACSDSTTDTQVRVKALSEIDDKSSNSNSDLGRNIDELLREIVLTDDAKQLLKLQYSKVQDHYSNVWHYTKEQILNKAIELKGNPNLDIYLVTALMNKANKIVTGYELRPAQISSTLEFFRESGIANKFCQVNTGEGKTTITSLVAVIKALQGDTVDIVTSNQVLAEDAVRDREDFYALFGLSVAHNNAKHGYDRGVKACYQHDIVYGTIGNFEFDYLKHRIKLAEVKGTRGFGSLIIDEADNVVLDNATNVAKLSGSIAGMEYLKYVYLNIWQVLIRAERILGLQDTEISKITLEDKRLIKNEISKASVKASIKDETIIPKFLESYVDRKLDSWISNAVHARYDYHQNQHYIIGKKDAEQKETSAEENIIPLDVRVGVTLQNTIWSDLHPFIQIKHNLQVTPDSLSSIFIANSEYIRLYKSVSGLTGTLGSQKEKEIIKTLYQANSTIIPTYKAGMMEYKTNKLVSDSNWLEEITKDAIEHALGQKRATLIVCETMQDVLDLEQQLVRNEQAKVITYRDEHDAHKIELINKTGGIEPSTIVIATNIGGRGTDIKLSEVVKANGGLHECTTFLASSSRILKQAFGRAARQGEPGSSRMIIKKSDLSEYGIKLKDNFSNEDISDLIDAINDARVSNFIPQITRAEQNARYFAEFADLYSKNKLLGMNYFILEDLRLEWALAFDERNATKIRTVFDQLTKAADNLKDYEHQFVNPYFAIKYVDSILATGIVDSKADKVDKKDHRINDSNKAKEEEELYDRAKNVLNQECIVADPELLYVASMKHFEIMVSQRQKNKLKQLADGIITSPDYSAVDQLQQQEYKQKARMHLENAQKALTARINYLKSIIGSASFDQIVLDKDDLNNDGENCMLKHIESKYTTLQLQLHHVNSLIALVNSVNCELVCISGKYVLNELIEHAKHNSVGLKICQEELMQTRNLGEDSFYRLGELPVVTVSNPTTKAAISAVASLFAKSALNFTFTESASMPTSSDLIDSGIYDIMRVILLKQEDQQSKAEDHLLDRLSFGFSSVAKCLKILHQVSKHVSSAISEATRESKFLKQFAPQITEELAVFSEELKQIKPKGILKSDKKPVKIAFEATKALEGNDITKDHDINGINSYFGKYTLDAIKTILKLRIKDAQVDNVKIVSDNYAFININNNNLADLFRELASSADSPIILAPLNLANRHAVGLMFIKQQNNFTLYYIDPENHEIPASLEQIFKEYQLDTKQLTVESQRYANCGPEVIENFMFCLTGKRLPQEQAIQYHSLLLEQDLLSSDTPDNQTNHPFSCQIISDENKVTTNQIMFNSKGSGIMSKSTISEDEHIGIIELSYSNTPYIVEVPELGSSPDFTLDGEFDIGV